MSSRIQTCLFFASQAEEAAKFYTSIFPDGKINNTHYFKKAGQDVHSQEPGSVMMVTFTINDTDFQALNGAQDLNFTPAVSFSVLCDDQAEIDHYWEKLGEGGREESQRCGWLQDKFGVSWQIVPRKMGDWVGGGGEGGERAFAAMMKMRKLEIETLKNAYEGRE